MQIQAPLLGRGRGRLCKSALSSLGGGGGGYASLGSLSFGRGRGVSLFEQVVGIYDLYLPAILLFNQPFISPKKHTGLPVYRFDLTAQKKGLVHNFALFVHLIWSINKKNVTLRVC